MNIYAVFLPRDDSSAHSVERATLVKQGFGWEAFLVTPIWAFRRRLWSAVGLWILWGAVATGVAFAFRISSALAILVYLIGAAAFGLEGDLFEQFHLKASGFGLRSFALGASAREVELVYFNRLAEDAATSKMKLSSDTAGHEVSSKAQTGEAVDLLGLFPSRESKI